MNIIVIDFAIQSKNTGLAYRKMGEFAKHHYRKLVINSLASSELMKGI